MTHQPATQPSANRPPAARGNRISLGALLALPAVFVPAALLTLVNLSMSALVLGGPDSCGEVSCTGSPLFAKIFLAIALVPPAASIAILFTLRPARFQIRCALIAIALAVPVLADTVVLPASPDWFW